MSTDSSIAARYEAAKSFDLEDDLEFCPVLTIDEVTTPSSPTVSEIPPSPQSKDADVVIIGTTILRRCNCKVNILSRIRDVSFPAFAIIYPVSPEYIHPSFPSTQSSLPFCSRRVPDSRLPSSVRWTRNCSN